MKHFWMLALLTITFSATAQVGIGTTTPAATALLDLTSTNKGFLPPRMTEVQREAISTPATGLMVYCTDCGYTGEPEYYNGSSWVNMVGAYPAHLPYTIGQTAQGGIIAYILVAGDPGYSATVQHGLVAATTDQSTAISWWSLGPFIFLITGNPIGTGSANTTAIITAITAQGSAGDYAAKLCRDYVSGGYTDWFLPSTDELNKLYLNKVSIGNFANSTYWTSTAVVLYDAFGQNFTDGSVSITNKATPAYVRAVRAF